MIIAIILGLIGGSGEKDLKADAYYMSHQFVEKLLKSPSTADFPNYHMNPDGVSVLDNGNGEYTVIGYVDAQNSFGATIRVGYTCQLCYLGDDEWQCENVELNE